MMVTWENTLRSIFAATVPVPYAKDTGRKEISFPFLRPGYKKFAPSVTTPSNSAGTTATAREYTLTTT
jgi:hypothetical protein